MFEPASATSAFPPIATKSSTAASDVVGQERRDAVQQTLRDVMRQIY